ncbi:hypothetical protein F5X96DRAFT_545084 [Biscogniauxia mediterranea]|nr:hypothetical protein F5X96DRAFT_545084 [Biscogniauxia mediterranea]
MLSKSSLSIRRLIPQRRSQNEYEEGSLFWDDETVPRKFTNKDGDKDPWLAKRRLNGKKRPPAPIIVKSPPSAGDLERPLPPLPDESPRSSSGSSCAYCGGNHVDSSCPHQLTGPRRSPLCSASSKGDRSAESLQLYSATSHGPDDFPSRQPSPKCYVWSSHHTKHRAQSSGSTLGSTGALSLPPDNEARSSKEHLGRKGSFQDLTENVRQLIQETDEAFKAVGNVLSDARNPDTSPNHPERYSTFELSPTTTSAPRHRLHQFGSKRTTFALQSPAAVSRVKRRKSKRSKKTQSMMPHRKPPVAKPLAKGGLRWTFTDNVSEIFTGKIFHRIEADEVLSPGQIEAFKLRRLSHLQAEMLARKSAENLDNDTADTPTEPFHLQDLPSRIGSSGVGSNPDRTTEERPRTSSSEEAVRREWERDSSFPTAELDSLPQQKIRKNNTFPIAAPQTLMRQSPRRQKTALSIIPETATPVATDVRFFSERKSHKKARPQNREDSEFIYLQCPPCTLNMPGFRHGPIRLDKSDLVPDMKLGGDDGLDWTAFQMAILGGAGDWFTDSDDTIRRREAEEAADIVEWWDSWGEAAPAAGALVTQDMIAITSAAAASSPTSTLSGGDNLSDVSYCEIEGDNPYSAHHHGWRQHHYHHHGGEFDLGGLVRPPHFRKWTPDSEEKQVVADVDRGSFISLPQSPMLDLKIIGGPDGEDMDVVPMGYNLGHDLGDFLKWEAEHAYAGDFGSPPDML